MFEIVGNRVEGSVFGRREVIKLDGMAAKDAHGYGFGRIEVKMPCLCVTIAYDSGIVILKNVTTNESVQVSSRKGRMSVHHFIFKEWLGERTEMAKKAPETLQKDGYAKIRNRILANLEPDLKEEWEPFNEAFPDVIRELVDGFGGLHSPHCFGDVFETVERMLKAWLKGRQAGKA